MAVVKSVEYVEITFDNASEGTWVALTKDQDPDQCTPWPSTRSATVAVGDQHYNRMGEVQFRDNAGTPEVRVSATGRSDSDDEVMQIFVVEWDSSITVQQVSVTTLTDTVTSVNISITDVGDQTTAFFYYSCQCDNLATSADDFNDGMIMAAWNGASTSSVTLSRSSGGGAGDFDGTLYVVECNSGEFTVQHLALLTIAAASNSNTASITEVVEADTFIIYHGATGEDSDDMRDAITQCDLQDSTTVRIRSCEGATTTNSQPRGRIQVVECNNNEWSVQRNDAVTMSTATVTDTITSVNRDLSIAQIMSGLSYPTMGRNNSTAGGDIGETLTAIDLSADDTVRLRKLSATLTNDIISYEVIEFAGDGGGEQAGSLMQLGVGY